MKCTKGSGCGPGGIVKPVNDHFVVKVSGRSGNVLWETFVPFSDNWILNDLGAAGDIYPTADGGFVYVGQNSNIPHRIGVIMKFDSLGNLIWFRQLFDSTLELEGTAVKELSSGNIIVALTYANGRSSIANFSSTGSLVWNRRYRLPGGSVVFRQLSELTDSRAFDIIVAGNIRVGSTESAILIRLNNQNVSNFSQGNIIWQYEYDEFKRFHAVKPAIVGGYIIAGTTSSDLPGLVKTDGNGRAQCEEVLNLVPEFTNEFTFNGYSLEEGTAYGNYVSTLFMETTPISPFYSSQNLICNPRIASNDDNFKEQSLIDDRSNLNIFSGNNVLYREEAISSNIKIFPNPTQGVFTISWVDMAPESIKILNVTGKAVKIIDHPVITGNSLQIDLSNEDPGVYFVETTSDNHRSVFRLIRQ